MTIDELIAKLRHDVLIGGGYADISSNDLELLIAEIDSLRARLDADDIVDYPMD